jgi:L-amino acid N-acyltransferase YncA
MVRRTMENREMVTVEVLDEPPPWAAPSVAAVVAGRWARTTGHTWPPPSAVVVRPSAPQPRWTPDVGDIAIARMSDSHAEQVLAIHQAGLDTDNASFETVAPAWDRFDAAHLAEHRFVAVNRRTGVVLGWVALAPVSSREVYAGVAEESIYVHPGVRCVGVGSSLLSAVIASSAAGGIWTLQAGIFPENLASIRLHRGHGFRVVGVRENIAQHRGRWRNMLLLERRDGSAGSVRPPAAGPFWEVDRHGRG